SGLGGLILRPLSAKLMDVTIPEKKGWVDREKLLDINGRSRKRQRELAKKFGIKTYPNAAGGCLLTQKDFSRRMKDLLENKKDISPKDVLSLRSGRHFRLPGGTKLVLGRDQKENLKLYGSLAPKEIFLITVDVPGPVGVLSGKINEDDRDLAAGIIAAYSDSEWGDIVEMEIQKGPSGKRRGIKAETLRKKEAERFLV
ncbi:MAG TPA: hypothetical protein PKZ41_02440, partial [Candidatus Omnitrophota bacterium]|nr:hypothetical protein [Candidatus Omnitrophota bacterium]